jgi:hypothetical protein
MKKKCVFKLAIIIMQRRGERDMYIRQQRCCEQMFYSISVFRNNFKLYVLPHIWITQYSYVVERVREREIYKFIKIMSQWVEFTESDEREKGSNVFA